MFNKLFKIINQDMRACMVLIRPKDEENLKDFAPFRPANSLSILTPISSIYIVCAAGGALLTKSGSFSSWRLSGALLPDRAKCKALFTLNANARAR